MLWLELVLWHGFTENPVGQKKHKKHSLELPFQEPSSGGFGAPLDSCSWEAAVLSEVPQKQKTPAVMGNWPKETSKNSHMFTTVVTWHAPNNRQLDNSDMFTFHVVCGSRVSIYCHKHAVVFTLSLKTHVFDKCQDRPRYEYDASHFKRGLKRTPNFPSTVSSKVNSWVAWGCTSLSWENTGALYKYIYIWYTYTCYSKNMHIYLI